jgi:hypothetical protein
VAIATVRAVSPVPVEVIPIQKVNEAYEKLLRSDVKSASPSTWLPSFLSKPTIVTRSA